MTYRVAAQFCGLTLQAITQFKRISRGKMEKYLIVLPIGFLAQFIDGTLGMGYGVSSSSFLLAAGFMPVAMSASVHASELFASLASGVSHLKLGNVDRGVTVPLALSGVMGGTLGAYFLSKLSGDLIKPYVAFLLLIMGARIILTHIRAEHRPTGNPRLSKRFLVPLGLIGGAVDAVGGGGWGPICTPAILATGKGEPRYAVGSVNAAEFLTTFAITATFAITLGLKKFLWGITVPLLIGGIIAAPLSAIACRRIDPGRLGTVIGAMLILLNLRIVVPVVSGALGVPPVVRLDSALTFGTVALVLVALTLRRQTSS